MTILDRLPIADRPHLITVRGEAVDVYRNQIIVWMSIGDTLRPFPAILDTGHSHNFSIAERQLDRWSGATLRRIGELDEAALLAPDLAAAHRELELAPQVGTLDDDEARERHGRILV